MSYVKVWCEYDISGNFGGNSDEEAFLVNEELTNEQIEEKVLERLTTITGLAEYELDGLYGWEVIQISEL